MITNLTLNRNLNRLQRDPVMPLSRITILCGPNGSGKSTFLDAVHDLINGQSRIAAAWTKETAPVLVEGDAAAVLTFSFERHNPRMLSGYDLPANQVVIKMLSNERSHGQSNFRQLENAFDHPVIDVLVLDEPESALDLDGLLWLREKMCTTDKQVIIATHSIAILSLLGKLPDVTVQCFGKEVGYYDRLVASYQAITAGKKIPKARKRLALPKMPSAQKSSSKRKEGARRFFDNVMNRSD